MLFKGDDMLKKDVKRTSDIYIYIYIININKHIY